ncbi:hypothetical protein [Pseudomonas sp. dw_358]|uniref:DUF6933 domain-containing protein n=1 Tax=Pseudomonas sp. dw_358 TaxID=2720083 RepID=UPI001BD5E071|nr:hypothetical protein [Pseudomonas sp. dw_358]
MLVFNCSLAASEFFSSKKAGKPVSQVEPALYPNVKVERDEQGRLLEQWVLHVVTLKRKHLVIAMHVKTRFVMAFLDIKKNDFDGFRRRFTEQWLLEMNYMAEYIGIFQHFDYQPRADLFGQLHQQVHLCKGSDRSVSGHINLFNDTLQYHGRDFVEEAKDDPSVLHEWFNQGLVKTGPKEEYGTPRETMFMHWWNQYSPVGEADCSEALREVLGHIRRARARGDL